MPTRALLIGRAHTGDFPRVAARLISFGGPRLLLAPALRLVLALIHRSARNKNSRKFALTVQHARFNTKIFKSAPFG